MIIRPCRGRFRSDNRDSTVFVFQESFAQLDQKEETISIVGILSKIHLILNICLKIVPIKYQLYSIFFKFSLQPSHNYTVSSPYIKPTYK